MINNQDNQILSNIQQGMEVYDANDTHLGDVDFVRFAEGHKAKTAPNYEKQSQTFLDEIADAFTARGEMPHEVRSRLLRHGFVRVDTSIFQKNYFITSHQIKSADEQGIKLNVPKEELMSNAIRQAV